MGRHPRVKTTLDSSLILLLFSAAVNAEPDKLAPLEVGAASYSFKTGDVYAPASTGYSSSIDQEKINRSQLSLGKLIDQESGAQVRESGGFGSYSEISLRGAGSDQVMIFLDGLLLSDGSGGGFDLSLLDPAQTSRIDVYRGSTPVQFGKSSLGGAVNLVTHQPTDKNRFTIKITGGSFGTQKLSASVSGKKGRNDGIVSVSSAASDNDFVFVNDNGTQYNPDDDQKQRRQNAQASRHSALLKAGRQISETRRLDATLQVQQKHRNIPSWNNHPETDASLDTQSWQTRGKITSDGHFLNSLNTLGELYLTRKTERYDDSNSSVGLGAQLNRYTTETQGARFFAEWVLDNASVELNADWHREEYRREDRLDFKPDDHSHRDTLTIGTQLSYYLLNQTLLLAPTLRLQQFENRYTIDSGEQHLHTYERHTSPQLGMQYTPYNYLTLKANVGIYNREPSFYELFGDRGLYQGNTELVAEQGVNSDIGLEWQSRTSAAWLEFLKIQAGAWYNTIDDMIARTYNAQGIGKSQNIASARLSGIEATLQMNLIHNVRLSLGLTHQNPENRSQNAAFKGKVLPGRDQRSYFASLTLPIQQWTLSYEFDSRSGRYYDTANLLAASNRELHHLTLSRSTLHGLGISLAVKNMTNKVYEDFNGYPQPGRAWYLTLNYEL